MKTLIEFFDDDQILNVNALLRFEPEKVVFIAFPKSVKASRKMAVEKFLDLRFADGRKPATEYVESAYPYHLPEIVTVLDGVTDENEDCYIDVTGGKETILIAAGILSERKNIPMFQFNIISGCLHRLKNCDDLPDTETPRLSVREYIVLNGGEIIRQDSDEEVLDPYDGFFDDVENMWGICQSNSFDWNRQVTAFQNFVKYGKLADDLTVSVNLRHLRDQKHEHYLSRYIMSRLEQCGLISGYLRTEETASFRFKNEQVFSCLTKAGRILELYTYTVLKEINEDDPGYFNDIATGVFIDWDGNAEPDGTPDIINEIDIILMRNEIPVFISCKNGLVKRDALYELNTLAQRFGNKNCKKIIIAVNGDSNSSDEEFLFLRAQYMGIMPIGQKQMSTKEKFKERLRNLTK